MNLETKTKERENQKSFPLLKQKSLSDLNLKKPPPLRPQTGQSLKKSSNTREGIFLETLRVFSLTQLIQFKLELFFQQQKEAGVQIDGLYDLFLEQIEKPLIELSLKQLNGNQLKTAKMLGINRNTLKSKIKLYGLKVKKDKFG